MALQIIDSETGQIDLHDLCVTVLGADLAYELVSHHSAFCGLFEQVDSMDDAYHVLFAEPGGNFDPTILVFEIKPKFDAFLASKACRQLKRDQNVIRTKNAFKTAIIACQEAVNLYSQTFGDGTDPRIELGLLGLQCGFDHLNEHDE